MAVDAASAVAAGSDAATPFVFFLCACCATVTGLLLAAIDNGEVKDSGGYSPAAHVGACADSADALFAGLSADGGGLGFFEPLWKLFSPDGAFWTLVTSGVSGLVSAAGTIFSGVARFATGGTDHHHAKSAYGAHLGPEKLDMTFLMELHAYWGYARLFAMGVVREYVIRVTALVWRDEVARSYVNRERWNSGWVEFYKAHMYKLYVDCFNRPISNAPDSTFDVIERERPGGHFFGPLHDFHCTERVRTCINLGSYNYLGFGGVDRFCVPQARQAAMEHGWSTGAARSEGGTLQVHRDLEHEVARFLSKEDALVLGMGFATNSTILPALFEAQAGGSGVLVLSDELNHRSIVEGVRLSGATVRAFAHNSMPELEAALQRAVTEGQPGGKPWRKVFIVVEGIYSMEGDFCRLREIVTLKNRYKAYLYLDEAHSIGAVGPTGRGVSELLGVPTSEIDVMMGTFTKSFGSAGGYVAASRDVIAALRRNAPGCVFAMAMSPPCAAQALAAFRVISGSEGGSIGADKLASIRDNANFFRKRLIDEGFKVLGDEDSPIVPVMLHHPQKMAWFSRQCLDKGIAVVVVGYPAVPVLYERVRFCLSAAHSRQQLAKVITEITAIGRNVGVLYERSADKGVVASRAARASEYAAWLRKAPLVTSSAADITEVAKTWTPEPLAPRALNTGGIHDAAFQAAVTVEERPAKGVEMRHFDPLGYVRRPLEAAQQATNATVDTYGFGACGPRGFYGTTRPHMSLEADLAKLLGTESAIAYSAGVATASSVLPALVTPTDRVIVDSEVHLGIRTGLRLCKAHTRWVPHGDLHALEEVLKKGPEPSESAKASKDVRPQRTFLIVEALCQRTGRIAELKEIVELKEKYGAFLVLDESISLGTLGASGRGLFDAAGVDISRIDAVIGSLEHAVAGVGGYCAGRKGMIDHQRLAGAGYCFSASCPPAACSAASAVLADLSTEGGAQRMARLRENAAALHRELRDAVDGAPLELVSSAGSFVQHLRWRGDVAEGEARLSAIARGCEAEALRLQVCSPGACDAEAAFGARTGSPPCPRPTLRLCASSEHVAEDIAAAVATLRRVLQAA